MKQKKETFASVIGIFEYRFDLRTVFDDFLTLSICAMGQNPQTGKSFDEDLYLETIEKYKSEPGLINGFSRLLALLTTEMEERWDSGDGYDVLGEFYEQNLYRKGASQYFTPWPICLFMAKSFAEQSSEQNKILRILDPCCGSGRMLMASQKCHGQKHEFYGIDLDHTCVKMTAVNLFLSGLFRSEVLCADALVPEDFRVSYKTSFLPFGLFRIQEKEKSRLWHMLRDTWNLKPTEKKQYDGTGTNYPGGSQLLMF
jgi:hypothetical protein